MQVIQLDLIGFGLLSYFEVANYKRIEHFSINIYWRKRRRKREKKKHIIRFRLEMNHKQNFSRRLYFDDSQHSWNLCKVSANDSNNLTTLKLAWNTTHSKIYDMFELQPRIGFYVEVHCLLEKSFDMCEYNKLRHEREKTKLLVFRYTFSSLFFCVQVSQIKCLHWTL